MTRAVPPQSEIPDDLKADTDLPLDVRGALDAIRHQAHVVERQAAMVVTAVDRLIAALAAASIRRGDDEA